ncbi:TIGR02679 family protein [Actinomycetospora cinnamomea]|uniref:Uncharacterized protein (TIGR02679 family) n=1 Tax=Actinomycetospora cinnamomea TaxID=663609 RepID=A0A2U1FFV2_9PSEU|nr:TIGR02679 family protein [Actinomycetospora cinnamomea]PVZ11037.1 uncharacterized protein (TIGR02679 family) [Actinomycetospora cinnamomea]
MLDPALRRPEFAALWAEVHERLSSGRPVSAVTLRPRTRDEELALAGLLDLRLRPDRVYRVSLAKLDAVLLDAAGRDARAVVAEIHGPLRDDAADRARAEAEREEVRARVRDHPVVAGQPALAEWAASVRFTDGSTSATRRLWEDALAVLGALPADGRPLPVLAQQVLGRPHALDDGTRLANLVLRGLAAIHDVEVPATAEARHALWERAGVSGDQLSVTVLAAGLRPAGTDLVPTLLRACADAGHAAALTLAQLRTVGSLEVGGPVFAVENPAVLALALERFGTACPPLVCTAGWPNGAAVTLLRLLPPVRYHGDLDGEGVRIAAHLATTFGAVPWRMTADDYMSSVPQTGPPVGRVSEAPWDPALAPALEAHRVAVHEERVAATLLDDMAAVAR